MEKRQEAKRQAQGAVDPDSDEAAEDAELDQRPDR